MMVTVEQAIQAHKTACEMWLHGNMTTSWVDDTGTLCIKYQDGTWYHYAVEDNCIVWW